MKSGVVDRLAERVNLALGKSAAAVTRRGPDCWNVMLMNGQVLRARAWLNDAWLHMDAALRQMRKKAQPGDDWMWNCLRNHMSLRGGAKYAIDTGNRLRIRAEVPLLPDADDIDLCGRVTRACEGLKAASDVIQSGAAECEKGSHHAGGMCDVNEDGCDLERLCEESGWAFIKRAGARLAVEMDVRDGYHQAIVQARPDGVHIGVGLGTRAAASAASRRALGLLLLTLGAALRMARTAGTMQGGQVTIWLEVLLPPCPHPTELAHAFSALSVGCDLCAREVEALLDDTTAREYLAIRGWSA